MRHKVLAGKSHQKKKSLDKMDKVELMRLREESAQDKARIAELEHTFSLSRGSSSLDSDGRSVASSQVPSKSVDSDPGTVPTRAFYHLEGRSTVMDKDNLCNPDTPRSRPSDLDVDSEGPIQHHSASVPQASEGYTGLAAMVYTPSEMYGSAVALEQDTEYIDKYATPKYYASANQHYKPSGRFLAGNKSRVRLLNAEGECC